MLKRDEIFALRPLVVRAWRFDGDVNAPLPVWLEDCPERLDLHYKGGGDPYLAIYVVGDGRRVIAQIGDRVLQPLAGGALIVCKAADFDASWDAVGEAPHA